MRNPVITTTGCGFRDIIQAAWSMTVYDPENAVEKICDCLAHQYADGHTQRGWNPVDDHYYSDGPV